MRIFKSLKYCVYVFWYVLSDKGTSFIKKILIVGAVVYFLLPVDFMPDLVPFWGITDDVAAIAACISVVSSSVTAEIKQKALNRLENGKTK